MPTPSRPMPDQSAATPDDRDLAGPSDYPPCPGCGTNDWQPQPDGSFKCAKCGLSLSAEEMARMQGASQQGPAPYQAPDTDSDGM